MAVRPLASPSPQARRQAQILALQAALVARDVPLIERLLGQWVHRQGVSALTALSQELDAANPEAWAWWQTLQSPAPEPVLEDSMLVAAEPLVPLPRLEPQLPRATRPAPAPSHPAVVQLRAWLPDQETRRAA
ncbi:hypothetical protein [Vulcanococcus sp. Clear-D1]|uniref:hypothetical protein n=1 Tax=Vulcanococcus sp. Clear-D1 TaxID=2766970 RepID=UPI0019BE06F3|nr:hypothetical protein [Vulcanococcus sp. Clear-D1]MBD1194816.1 hypothetical protein [Vulcanococcus sp. Clear-D1]